MSRFKQGYYRLRNPEKYRGDPNNIKYRSSWELHANEFFDSNPNVLEWSSEEIKIPYIKPTDKRMHTYIPDYYIKYKNSRGCIVHEIIEVKPSKDSKPSRSKNSRTRLYENLTYAINVAKWESCARFCKKKGIGFKIITEKELFK